MEGVLTWPLNRIKYKTCQRVEDLLVSQRTSRDLSGGANCVWRHLPAVSYLPEEFDGRVCTLATTKHFTLQNTP